jgi:hypothetical protein
LQVFFVDIAPLWCSNAWICGFVFVGIYTAFFNLQWDFTKCDVNIDARQSA